MAITTQTLMDKDWEVVTKSTITGTNGTALKVVDVSALEGAATDPRVTIVAIWWTVSSVTEIEWNADSNVTAFTLNGNGNYNASAQALPSNSNNAGTGIDGDISIENDSACTGTVIIKMRKVSGWDNIERAA